jgi:hypothetical protein
LTACATYDKNVWPSAQGNVIVGTRERWIRIGAECVDFALAPTPTARIVRGMTLARRR